jgi:phosphoserine phosphatase RsbU/P
MPNDRDNPDSTDHAESRDAVGSPPETGDHGDGHDPHVMQCMEVWGGNRSIDNGVSMPGLDAWVYSKPYKSGRSGAVGSEEASASGSGAAGGGGDIHYLSSCMTGRISRLLIADVAGHGAAVNDIAVSLRDLMREYVNYLDQGRFVKNLNVRFSRLSEAGCFATAVVATYWAPTEYLVATNAGHPRPLLYRAKTNQWEYLDSSGTEPRGDSDVGEPSNLPLGLMEPTSYDQFAVKLAEGDLVLLYTDSLIESVGADRRQLGERGLLEVVRSLPADRPQAVVAALVAAVAKRQGSEEFDDDVTCLLLRRNGVKPTMGVGDIANGIARLFGQAIGKLGGNSTPLPWPEMRLETIGGLFSSRLNERWRGS